MNDGHIAAELFADLTGPRETNANDNFRLIGQLPRATPIAFSAITATGRPAVVIPLAGKVAPSVRLTLGLTFSAIPALDFRFGTRTWSAPAAVLQAEDDKLLRTFVMLAASVVGSLSSETPVGWSGVVRSFERWDALLHRRRVLEPERELGLWGELSVIASSARLDDLILAWTGPDAGIVDFFLEGRAFEIKTTRRPGVYFVSHDQVELESLDATFVALEVAPDPVGGRSLSDMVDEVSRRCADPIEFEEKILAAGFSPTDAAAYTRRYAWLGRPRFYPRHSIPRVRAADPGVSRLRYRVDLDGAHALPAELEAAAEAVLGLTSH